jgi:hypothetical protein
VLALVPALGALLEGFVIALFVLLDQPFHADVAPDVKSFIPRADSGETKISMSGDVVVSLRSVHSLIRHHDAAKSFLQRNGFGRFPARGWEGAVIGRNAVFVFGLQPCSWIEEVP